MSDSDTLSPRQREILALAAQGQTSEQIGQALGISGATVKNHLTRASGRRGARSRTQAVLLAVQRGLIAVALLLALLLALASPVAAQTSPPDRVWRVGWVERADLGPDYSWFYAVSPAAIAPTVRIEGRTTKTLASLYCPGGDGPQTCTVSVFGPWTRITIDGQVVAERGRLYLPLVRRGG